VGDAVTVGFIRRPHGLKGEVMVEDLTDGVFLPVAGQAVTLVKPGAAGVATSIERWTRTPGGVIAAFEGLATREDAEARRGWELEVARDLLPPRPEGGFYEFELVGLPVVTSEGEVVGEAVGFYRAGAFDILQIRDGNRTYEVPFVREHVLEVRPGERIVITPYREE